MDAGLEVKGLVFLVMVGNTIVIHATVCSVGSRAIFHKNISEDIDCLIKSAFSFGYGINMDFIHNAFHGLDKMDLRSGI